MTRGLEITSTTNPRLRAAAALRDRRERERSGLTIVDGARELRRALDADRCVEIPADRELAVSGLDSRRVPAALISAARLLLEPAHLLVDDTTA